MSGYAGPFTEDLTATWEGLDLTTLWNTGSAQTSPLYPLEPVVSQRDLIIDSSHPFSPYRPYFKPSTMAPVNVELPATTLPGAGARVDDAGGHARLARLRPSTTCSRKTGRRRAGRPRCSNPDGSTLTNLETFDGSQRYFGSIMANCERALTFAVPYLSGTPVPEGRGAARLQPRRRPRLRLAVLGRRLGVPDELDADAVPAGTAATPTPWTPRPG